MNPDLKVNGRYLEPGDIIRYDTFSHDRKPIVQRFEIVEIGDTRHQMGIGFMREAVLRDMATGVTETQILKDFSLKLFTVDAGLKLERLRQNPKLAQRTPSGQLLWRPNP